MVKKVCWCNDIQWKIMHQRMEVRKVQKDVMINCINVKTKSPAESSNNEIKYKPHSIHSPMNSDVTLERAVYEFQYHMLSFPRVILSHIWCILPWMPQSSIPPLLGWEKSWYFLPPWVTFHSPSPFLHVFSSLCFCQMQSRLPGWYHYILLDLQVLSIELLGFL